MPRMGKGYLPLLYIPDGAGRYAKLPSLTTAQRDALTAIKGMLIWNSTTSALNQYNGSSWGTVGVSDHGALSGLTDDDHTQYMKCDTGGRTVKIVRKTADQTVTSSVTVADDDELVLAVGANEVWHIRTWFRVHSATNADWRYVFTVPSGATLLALPSGYDYDTFRTPYDVVSNELTPATSGNATDVFTFLMEYVGSSTAGNIQLKWAQKSSQASDTKVLANSFMIAERLA